jgi:tRNA (guanine-N7-)-methyltransferase
MCFLWIYVLKQNTFAAMAQKKLERFAELKTFNNVLEYPPDMQGQWKERFNNDNPITLELACGKGEYTVALAELYPQRNFIGVDLKGNRIWVGARLAIKKQLTNAAFLRTQIEMIDRYFSPDEVNEIWITFPDPQLRLKRAKKRLTHPNFLRLYQKFLARNGVVHLKTDSPKLYAFTKAVAGLYGLSITTDSDNLYAEENISPELQIKTYYESLDIAESNRIFYLAFKLDGTFVDKQEELKAIIQSEAE